MIKIKDYYVDADAYGYVVKQYTCDDKKGEPQYKALNYHSTIDSAVEAILRLEQRRYVANNNVDIQECLKAFQSLHAEFKAILGAVKRIESLKGGGDNVS